MSVASTPIDPPPTDLRSAWRDADVVLRRTAWAILALVPISVGMALVDGRVLDGSPLWHKPIKFQVSVGVFLLTLAMMVPYAGRGLRVAWWGRATVWTAVGTAVFEIVWITLQAARGLRSHYNDDHLFGEAMYALMGIAAVLLSLTPMVVAVATWWRRGQAASFVTMRWSLTGGTLATLAGAVWVGLMLGGSPDHYPGDAAAAEARLPFAGWSTREGDLRIAHFIGLHALQGMFLLGFVLAKAPVRIAGVLVSVVALVWIGAVVALAQLAVSDRSVWPLTLM